MGRSSQANAAMWLYALCSVCAAGSCVVVVSAATPTALLSAFSQLQDTCEMVQIQTNNASFDSIHAGVVIDALGNEFLSRRLRAEVADSVVVIDGNGDKNHDELRLFATKNEQFESLWAIGKWANATRLGVLAEEKLSWKGTTDSLGNDFEVSFFAISQEIANGPLAALVQKLIKPQGLTTFLVLLPRPLAQRCLQVMSLLHMEPTVLLSRESVLLSSESDAAFPSFASTGALAVVDIGCEKSLLFTDFLRCTIENALNNQRFAGFALVNVVDGRPIAIGTVIGQRVSLFAQWTKAGGNSQQSEKAVLTISMNNGTMNPSGEGGTYEIYNYNGAALAIATINNDSVLLPYFQLKMFPLSLGLFEFNLMWALKQLGTTSREELGVAMVAGQYSGVTVGVIGLMKVLNYSIPIVGASTTSPKLSPPQAFPLFTRVIMSDAYMSVLYVRMIKHFGWAHVAVLHCDDVWCQGLYDLFAQKCAEEGISIVNNSTLRMIPVSVDRNSTDYNLAFQNIVDSKARILLTILYGNALYLALSGLYDAGLRAGDVMLLAIEWLSMTIFEDPDELLVLKMKELCRGAVQFFPADFIGDIGAKVKADYIAAYGVEPATYACFNFDAVLLIAHALDFLVTYGGSYESPEVLNKQMRQTRFRGCSGIVTIADGSNDRAPIMYGILNLQVSMSDEYSIVKVGTYDPAGLVLFNFSSPIVWPDNSTSVPSDLRTSDIDCPFQSKQIVTYKPGLAIAYLVLSLICIISIGITVFIWRKWWNFNVVALTTRAEISFDDYILFATIGLETLQYAAMGPDFPSWLKVMSDVGNAVSINMEHMMKMSNGMFWIVLDAVLAGVGLWTVCLFVIFFHLDLKWEFLCSRVGDLSEKVLPILGNLCFLPIISTIMNVFQCTEAVDKGGSITLQSTFLRQDCYQRCWTSPHLPYALVSLLGLFLYLPAAVFMRPAWQNLQPYLHVFTASGYLMIKTIYQLLVIVLNKTLKTVHPLPHAFVFLTVTTAFLLFTVKWKPYGYARPNLWHLISLICVIWLNVLSILDLLVSGASPIAWVSIFLSGLSLLFAFGFTVQVRRMPAMLYRKKGIHVNALFKFMFSRAMKYEEVLSSERTRRVSMEVEGRQRQHDAVVMPTFAPTQAAKK